MSKFNKVVFTRDPSAIEQGPKLKSAVSFDEAAFILSSWILYQW